MQTADTKVTQHESAARLVRGYTTITAPQTVEAIAARMVTTGECVWHAAAQVLDRPCFCAECRPDIGRMAGR